MRSPINDWSWAKIPPKIRNLCSICHTRRGGDPRNIRLYLSNDKGNCVECATPTRWLEPK